MVKSLLKLLLTWTLLRHKLKQIHITLTRTCGLTSSISERKKITQEGISNIQQRTTSENDQDNLDHVIDFLSRQQGSITKVIVDEENNFKGLIYQKEYMHTIYSKFPEIMVDATYKLLELRMPLYLVLAIDRDGSNEM